MESLEPRRRQTTLREKALETKALLALDKHERSKVMAGTAAELLGSLRETGAVEFSNLSEMYAALRGTGKMIVRREDPERVLELTVDQSPVSIDFPPGDRYSNAVEWESGLGPTGLSNAYLEGYGHINGAVTVIGFKKGSLDIISLPDAEQRFAGLDRTYVRSVKGEVRPNDVLFVTTRVPITAFPEKEMTEPELDLLDAYREFEKNGKKPPAFFVQRGFLYTKNLDNAAQ